MEENSIDYKYCVKDALDNARKRISLLNNSDRKCVLEEYKEWINDGLDKHTVLLLREDPIIQNLAQDYFQLSVLEVALNKIYRLIINAIIRKIVKEERLSITRTKDNFNYNSFKLPSNSIFFKKKMNKLIQIFFF